MTEFKAGPQRKDWWRLWRPESDPADWRERTRVVVGATLGILVTAVGCRLLGGESTWPWLIAPMGASAVLMFALPASPLAQPWAVVGGNTLSALVGLVCVRMLGESEFVAAAAVGLAIALMFALRCLHPPGGASALLVALGGVSDPRYVLFPVLANALLLAAVGLAYNRATRSTSTSTLGARGVDVARDGETAAVDADLDAVLARHNQVLAISRDDLKTLLQDTQLRGYQRKLANLRCGDIMSSTLITVKPRTPLRQAWTLFGLHRIKALPVVDAAGGIVGIITPADFMRAAMAESSKDFYDRHRRLRAWAGETVPGQEQEREQAPEHTVSSIMTRKVRVASISRHLTELVPLFASTGHHHIPIVDSDDRLVGMVTQSDVVAALASAVSAPV